MRASLSFASDHPSYAGHFPRFPLLPGALLLDAALHSIARDRGIDLTQWQIASAKFLSMARPGDQLSLEHDAPNLRTIHFTISSAAARVASGSLTLRDDALSARDGPSE